MQGVRVEETERALSPHILEAYRANESLQLLAGRIGRKGGSVHSATTYLEALVRLCESTGETPDELLKKSVNWSTLLNQYMDGMAARGLSRIPCCSRSPESRSGSRRMKL